MEGFSRKLKVLGRSPVQGGEGESNMAVTAGAQGIRRLDAIQMIRYGWEVTMANLSLIIVVMIVAMLATGIPSGLAEALERPAPALSGLIRLAGFLISTVVGIGALRISLRLHDGQQVALRDLFAVDWSTFWRYLVATILYTVIVAVGLIFLVIPGVYFGVKYVLFGYFVVEKGARPVEALGQSSAATEGVRWDIFVLGLALLLLNFVGALFFLIGLVVTVPTSYLAAARVYRTLTPATK